MAKRDYDTIVVNAEVIEEAQGASSAYADASREQLAELLGTKEALVKSYEAELDKLKNQLSTKEQQVSDCNAEYDKLLDQVEEKQAEIKEMEQNFQVLQNENRRLEENNREIGQLKGQIEDLEQQLVDKDNAAKNMQYNLEKSHKGEVDQLNEVVESLQGEVAALKVDNKKSKAELTKAKKKVTELMADNEGLIKVNFDGVVVSELPDKMGDKLATVEAEAMESLEDLMGNIRKNYVSACLQVIEEANAEIEAARKLAEEDAKDEADLRQIEAVEAYNAAKRAEIEERRRRRAASKDEA